MPFRLRRSPMYLSCVGKTVLASAIIDACMQTSGFDTSYFYCHDGDQSTNSALSILKGLANLLLNQHVEDLLPAFHNGKATSGDASLRSLPTAQKLLEDCCSILPRVFLVVDGLDECEAAERKLALESLTKLVGDCNATKPGKLRVLVVSQYYSDIQRGLQSSGTAKVAPAIVQISEADNEGDIRTYVKIWVDKIASKNHSTESPFSEHMKEYLRNRTLVNAKGNAPEATAKFVLTSSHRNVSLCETSTGEFVLSTHTRRGHRCHQT
jgi:hypothetical protein